MQLPEILREHLPVLVVILPLFGGLLALFTGLIQRGGGLLSWLWSVLITGATLVGATAMLYEVHVGGETLTYRLGSWPAEYGIAYVVDADGGFDTRINGESVLVERGLSHADEAELRELIERHVALTGSTLGQQLLANWTDTVAATWKVIPRATLLLQVSTPDQVEARGAAD